MQFKADAEFCFPYLFPGAFQLGFSLANPPGGALTVPGGLTVNSGAVAEIGGTDFFVVRSIQIVAISVD